MKKVLSVFLLIVLLFAGLLLYHRYRIGQNLSTFSQGRTFKALGLTLEIPPVTTGVKGIFSPYVEVGGAALSLNYDSQAMKWALGPGRLKAEFWSPDSIQFVVSRWNLKGEEAVFEDLAFRLEPEGSLKQIRAKVFSSLDSKTQELLKILQPSLTLGIWEGFLPDLWEIGWQGVELGKPGSADLFQLGSAQLGLRSSRQESRRLWEVFFKGKGGKTHLESGSLEVKPWDFNFRGQVSDMPRQKAAAFVEAILGPLLQVIQGSSTESAPGPETIESLFQVYEDAVEFIIQLDLRPESGRYEWGGLKWESADKSKTVLVGSTVGKGAFRLQEQSFSGSSEFLFDGTEVHWGEHDFELKGLKVFYSGEYKVSYTQLLKNFLTYYRELGKRALRGMSGVDFFSLAAAFANYPDQARYEIKADKIYYKTPTTEGKHRNWTLAFGANHLGMTLSAKGDVQIKFFQDPSKDIPEGSLDLSWGLRLPWEKWLRLSRQTLHDPTTAIDWKKEFLGDLAGLEVHADAELGKNWFGGKLDWRLLGDLGLAVDWFVRNQEQPTSKDELVVKYLLEFMKEGTFDFSLLLRRWSQIQALIQKKEPEAALGLAVVIPFVEMDTQADTLKVRLELKEGHILLNGKRNEWIEGWVKKMNP